MSKAFVWFHNHSQKPNESKSFYEKLLGWKLADGPPGMTIRAPLLLHVRPGLRFVDLHAQELLDEIRPLNAASPRPCECGTAFTGNACRPAPAARPLLWSERGWPSSTN